jgi:hypothetical protein
MHFASIKDSSEQRIIEEATMSDFVHIESPSSIHQTGNASTTPKPSPSLLAFLDAHPLVRPAVIDKIYGCIIGSALGDTIGLYTEFMTKAQSAQVYADRQFRLVEPATELYPDSHRSEHFQLDEIFPISHVPALSSNPRGSMLTALQLDLRRVHGRMIPTKHC